MTHRPHPAPWRLACLLLSACSGPTLAPTEEPCARFVVDGIRDGVDGLLHRPEVPLALEGQPTTATLYAPLTSCVSDALAATAWVTDPDGATRPVALEQPPEPVGVFGAVRVRLRFTPTRPGPHLLQLAVEPALGTRAALVHVAQDGRALPSTVVPAADCPEAWPLEDDLLACEGDGGLWLRAASGAAQPLPGAHLVVVDRVAWSISPAGELERRALRDGGLVRTHAWPGFAQAPTPALHGADVALRLTPEGSLQRVSVDGGQAALAPRAAPGAAWLLDGDGALLSWGAEGCTTGACTPAPDVLAVDPEVLWRRQRGVLGWRWPWRLDDAPALTLPFRAASTALPRAAFERAPLWLDEPLPEGLEALVGFAEGALHLSAWPRALVLRVGPRHVLLREGDGGVRVVRRRSAP